MAIDARGRTGPVFNAGKFPVVVAVDGKILAEHGPVDLGSLRRNGISQIVGVLFFIGTYKRNWGANIEYIKLTLFQ